MVSMARAIRSIDRPGSRKLAISLTKTAKTLSVNAANTHIQGCDSQDCSAGRWPSQLLPASANGVRLRHALEVRHASFARPDFLHIARDHNVTVVLEDDETYPGFADATGDFIYARLRRSVSSEPTGYPPLQIKQWAARARIWARGEEPDDLPRVEKTPGRKASPRDVFIYFINGAKERAPAAAVALLRELG